MTAYYVSTPHFTCLVETDKQGRIVQAAPYLRRWRGMSWRGLLWELHSGWGKEGLRIARLPDKGSTPAQEEAP
jgi:hypothetical protein